MAKLTNATVSKGFLHKMMRQKQKTIIAQSASPVYAGIQLIRLEISPKGIRMAMPIIAVIILRFMGYKSVCQIYKNSSDVLR